MISAMASWSPFVNGAAVIPVATGFGNESTVNIQTTYPKQMLQPYVLLQTIDVHNCQTAGELHNVYKLYSCIVY